MAFNFGAGGLTVPVFTTPVTITIDPNNPQPVITYVPCNHLALGTQMCSGNEKGSTVQCMDTDTVPNKILTKKCCRANISGLGGYVLTTVAGQNSLCPNQKPNYTVACIGTSKTCETYLGGYIKLATYDASQHCTNPNGGVSPSLNSGNDCRNQGGDWVQSNVSGSVSNGVYTLTITYTCYSSP